MPYGFAATPCAAAVWWAQWQCTHGLCSAGPSRSERNPSCDSVKENPSSVLTPFSPLLLCAASASAFRRSLHRSSPQSAPSAGARLSPHPPLPSRELAALSAPSAGARRTLGPRLPPPEPFAPSAGARCTLRSLRQSSPHPRASASSARALRSLHRSPLARCSLRRSSPARLRASWVCGSARVRAALSRSKAHSSVLIFQ
ncbi:hypothetical protein GUJ93_ZPchr0008g12198 [Zizania palustris]|uniref:Uncharacterized protein n=1 Tax=Zizania palustris TaxID=103762 RepID=A0A8J5RJI8_ZIZPA|nr:hypothetical protein GUJ93_ZPchr0008g12198 [Zizania palustris]